MSLRPLHKVGPSCWRTHDGRYEICKHLGDPHPQRWFAFDIEELEREPPPALNASVPTDRGGADALNPSEGHIRLYEVVDWLEREDARV